MRKRLLDRSNWDKAEKCKCVVIDQYHELYGGYAAATRVDKVKTKLCYTSGDQEICALDDGYVWIQILPMGENWAMMIWLDEKREIIQWYFDITAENGVDENGRPYLDDLFLDVVVYPDGETLLLDEDELQEALGTGQITQDEYDLAWRTANSLLCYAMTDFDDLREKTAQHITFFDTLLKGDQL